MSIVKINAITVPPEAGEDVAARFADRAGTVEGSDGFEGFELLRPTDDRDVWLVVTHWRDEEAFVAWTKSAAFARGHEGMKSSPIPHVELWSYEVATSAPSG